MNRSIFSILFKFEEMIKSILNKSNFEYHINQAFIHKDWKSVLKVLMNNNSRQKNKAKKILVFNVIVLCSTFGPFSTEFAQTFYKRFTNGW
jgi:hypothetical protein